MTAHDPHDHHHHHHHDHDHPHSHAHDLAPLTAHAPPQPDEKVHAYHQVLGLALKELLIEKGVFTADEIRKAIEFRDTITPAMGARIVARAWTDPAYKKRLLDDGTAAIKEFGHDMGALHLVVVENTQEVHNVIVCTLCSCYPRAILGLPPSWYKSREYRARAVREPRAVLKEFGTSIADSVEVRVHDSTADLRYLVLPMRPEGTEKLSEAELAALVTRDCMIGVTLPRTGLIMLTAAERRAKFNAIFRVASCNFLEAYDFIVFAYYARYIGQTFFPSENPYLEIVQTLFVFGAGFVVRPIGAILLGGYMDKHGRRKGLILTLGLMAVGTLTIAVTPGYATIGWLAPFIVIVGRLLQGLSAGAEFGGVAIYLAEIATPGRRGFYCSWQAVSQQAAVIASALIGVILTALVVPADMTAWGWRIPLLIGVVAIPFLYWLRRSLPETEVFIHSRHVRSLGEVLRLLGANWVLILNGVALSVMTTTSFYLITAYTPTYGQQVLRMSPQDSLLVTLFVGVSNLLWLPVGGVLTDRFGGRPVMLLVTATALLTAYPAMGWLVIEPDFTKLLAVLMLFSLYFGLYNGALIPTLASIMPQEVRATAFSLAFVTATAIFGGFTPLVATFLVEVTGDRASPALWLSLAAAISLTAAFVLPFVQSVSQGKARAGAVAG